MDFKGQHSGDTQTVLHTKSKIEFDAYLMSSVVSISDPSSQVTKRRCLALFALRSLRVFSILLHSFILLYECLGNLLREIHRRKTLG